MSTVETHSYEKDTPGVPGTRGCPQAGGSGVRGSLFRGLEDQSSLLSALTGKGPAAQRTRRRAVRLTQCREPMHSFAASSGMVASSGFRRMHSLSTFTARADLAKGDHFCETQNV